MLTITTFASLVASASAAMNISLCLESPCKDPIELQLDVSSGCRTDFAGQVMVVNAQPSDPESTKKQAARFYRSTDCFGHCGSKHLIRQVTNGGAMVAGYMKDPVMQSFEVVDLDDNGKYPPHGYCGIRHGDAQYFRGRTWKWQQIGVDRDQEPVFREIPIEEWDDALYPQETTSKYVRHGAVNSMGTLKWWQHSDSGWSGMPLERWDDQIHILNQEMDSMTYLSEEEEEEEEEEEDHELALLREEMERMD